MKFEDLFLSHQDELDFLEKKMAEEPENETYRRLMVRTIFSNLEIIASGLIEYSKPLVIPKLLRKIEANKTSLTAHNHNNDYEILFAFCAADDKSYRIDDNGAILVEKPKVSLKNRLLFSIKLLFEARNQNVNPKTVVGWTDFLNAIKIRDRVTHPKILADLKVSKEDSQTVKMTLVWVAGCIGYGQEDEFVKSH